MKKTLLIFLCSTLSMTCMAQRIHSEQTFFTYARAGLSLSNFTQAKIATSDYANFGTNIKARPLAGYNVSVGFHHEPFRNSNFFWGSELAATTRGFNFTSNQLDNTAPWRRMMHSIRFTPIQVGYKYQLPHHWAVEAYLGGWLNWDYAGGDPTCDMSLSDIRRVQGWNTFDGGLRIGIGAWYRNYNLDIAYNNGLRNNAPNELFAWGFSYAWEICLGYAF